MNAVALRILAALLVVALPLRVESQGGTTAAIHGSVRTGEGAPVEGASVRATHQASGRRWLVRTRADGRYWLENLSVGGPYRIDVTALGLEPVSRDGILLALGERARADFELEWSSVRLTPVLIIAERPSRGTTRQLGPTEVIDRETIDRLPNPGRDFLALTALSSQAALSASTPAVPTSGIAIGGQNRVYNSFQIDGGIHQDLYRGQVPGHSTLRRPISLEAIEEIAVLAAPFDVRYGSFAGGLVNAVTRSGTNEMRGAIFGMMAHSALVGSGRSGASIQDFAAGQYGATLGGPIVRDRAHFFVSVDVQRSVVPDPGPLLSDTAGARELERIGLSHASGVRLREILQDRYGLDAGGFGPDHERAPVQDILAKLTLQLATNNHLDVMHHQVSGTRQPSPLRTYGIYRLSSTIQRDPSASTATRLIWTSHLGRWSNELLASRLRLVDRCERSSSFPGIVVRQTRGDSTREVPSAARSIR